MVVDKTPRGYDTKADWGAARARMVSRYDRPVNALRRDRPTRADHQHHHAKTKRMQR